jgi:hypothetical protein
MGDTRMFRFDQLDRTGAFLGLGLAQLAILALGTLLTTVAITARLVLPLAALPIVVTALVAVGRFRGTRLIDLIPLLISWCVRRQRREWRAPLSPFNPQRPDRQPPLPPWLAGIELREAPDSWGRLAGAGILADTTTGELSTVVQVRGHGFALAERDEQIRLLAGWGDVLAGFCTERGTVTKLTWSDFATPTGMQEHRRWRASQPFVSGDAADDYDALLDTTAANASHHDVTVTITVAAPPSARRRDRTDDGAAGLHNVTAALLRALRNAGLDTDDPLTATEIAGLLRVRLDPRPSALTSGGSLAERLGLVSIANAGPLATAIEWDAVRVDGSWHRTYWVSEWPRLQQHPDWMEPVLAFAGVGSRAITVIFEPVAPSVSQRRIDRDSVKLESDANVREDKGRRVGAHHRRLQASVAEREAELVAGFAELAYAAVIIVTADTRDDLAAGCDETEQLAREHGLHLRPLDGRHDQGLAAGLPLGLGLARTWIR